MRIAGPVCLAVATAFAVATWALNPREPGFAVVAGAWLLAALTYLVAPRVLGWTIGAAVLATIGAVATVGARPGVGRRHTAAPRRDAGLRHRRGGGPHCRPAEGPHSHRRPLN